MPKTQNSFSGSLSALLAKLEPFTYPLLRIAVGGLLIPHGVSRLITGGLAGTAATLTKNGLEPAYALAVYVTILEIVGGTLIALGFMTRFVAVLVLGFLVTAIWVHSGIGYFWVRAGAEMPLFWSLMALIVFIKGGGAYSVDQLISRDRH